MFRFDAEQKPPWEITCNHGNQTNNPQTPTAIQSGSDGSPAETEPDQSGFLYLPEPEAGAEGRAGSQQHFILTMESRPHHDPVSLTPPPAGSRVWWACRNTNKRYVRGEPGSESSYRRRTGDQRSGDLSKKKKKTNVSLSPVRQKTPASPSGRRTALKGRYDATCWLPDRQLVWSFLFYTVLILILFKMTITTWTWIYF